MKRRVLAILLSAIMVLSAAALTACGQKEADTDNITETAVQTEAATQAADDTAAQTKKSSDNQDFITTTANVSSNGVIDASDIFSDRDLRQNADLSEAVSYTVKDGQDITITSAGVYVLSGSASEMSVIVDAADEDKVQLVLDGVSITNTSTPCIYVKNADKVFVTTASGTSNSLTVSGSFSADGDTNTDAVIFSKDDLVLNGLGSLSVSSTDNGISCKDDLKITGGTIDITCSSDAIEANDSIAIADGSITVNSGKDALHAENDEDNSVGWIYICGGSFDLSASSDGIQGTTVVQIDGGSFKIRGSEGIEATYVQINGGSIDISASDDGINATSKSNAYTVTVEVNGGDITIDMAQGDTDGIDSNGNLYINGGTLDITCNSPFDYDGSCEYNGGTLIVNGEQTNEITNQMMGGGMMGGGPGMGGQDMGGQGMGGPGGFGR